MMNIGPMTEVSLLLGTIICLGAFFLIDNNIPAQALHKEEQLLEDYDDLQTSQMLLEMAITI